MRTADEIAGIVARNCELRGRRCMAGALGGSFCERPASHVVFLRSIYEPGIPVCRYHASAANRIGEGAYKL